MSTEINTRGAICVKAPYFPTGSNAECLTKGEIIANGYGVVDVNGSYDNNECPIIDDVIAQGKSIWLGYRTSDGKFHLSYNLSASQTVILSTIPTVNNYLFIVLNYPNFSNAKKIDKIVEKKILDTFVKISCLNGIGSCPIDNFTGKINDNLGYFDFIFKPDFMPSWLGDGSFLITLTAKDASSNVIETVVLNFEMIVPL